MTARKTSLILPEQESEEDKIWKLLGGRDALKDFDFFLNRILVVKWRRTMASRSILAPEHTRKEDLYQGKVGLVVKLGPAAFLDDEQAGSFYGAAVSVGDWVCYRASDGIDLDFCPPGSTEKVPCRILLDGDVIGRVPRPDFFY